MTDRKTLKKGEGGENTGKSRIKYGSSFPGFGGREKNAQKCATTNKIDFSIFSLNRINGVPRFPGFKGWMKKKEDLIETNLHAIETLFKWI